MVLTVAALLATMMVSAGPAQAQANDLNFENSTSCLQGGDQIFCGIGDEFGDDVGSFGFDPFGFDPFGFGDGLTFFNSDDDESFGAGDINDQAFLLCDPCNFDTFAPGGVGIS
jgi:hypothetical protein